MFTAIQQHVLQRVPNLSRALQQTYVIPTGEHAPLPLKDPIHRPRDSRGDRVHSPPQRNVIVAFDDQMEMVSQDRLRIEE